MDTALNDRVDTVRTAIATAVYGRQPAGEEKGGEKGVEALMRNWSRCEGRKRRRRQRHTRWPVAVLTQARFPVALT